ncbi:hypothetical protein SBV1_90022 [Verrucomicrobia bacterium]|nr:hypothetical protein SBV1_90022 [Verrucomicrobiota bacterium]
MQLIQPLDAIALFARHPLTFLANVNGMTTAAELLIRARPAADSAIMSHVHSAPKHRYGSTTSFSPTISSSA